jgi:hypothetical protein
MDFLGEYVFLDHFRDRVIPNPDDAEGLLLTADEPKKIVIYLSGDNIGDWIAALNGAIALIKRKVRPDCASAASWRSRISHGCVLIHFKFIGGYRDRFRDL